MQHAKYAGNKRTPKVIGAKEASAQEGKEPRHRFVSLVSNTYKFMQRNVRRDWEAYVMMLGEY